MVFEEAVVVALLLVELVLVILAPEVAELFDAVSLPVPDVVLFSVWADAVSPLLMLPDASVPATRKATTSAEIVAKA